MAYLHRPGGAIIRGPANAVAVVGDWTGWGQGRPQPLDGGEVFVELPADALVEYAFETVSGERLADPDNDEASNPFRPEARVLRMKGAPAEPVEPAARLLGETSPLAIATPALGGRRRATLYSPARILFLRPDNRVAEYAFNEAFAETVAGPVREAFSRVAPWPAGERTIAWGASLGGMSAIWLAASRPDVFGRATSQSGVLSATDAGDDLPAGVDDPATRCFPAGYAAPTYLDCGSFEGFKAGNRHAAGLLQERGVHHEYREHVAGHSWLGWRQGIGPALRFHLMG